MSLIYYITINKIKCLKFLENLQLHNLIYFKHNYNNIMYKSHI